MKLDGLASCAELTTEHADQAARSASSLRALLTWASTVAKPGGGAPKVLLALARLARADWLEGTPFIEITGTDRETVINIFADHGMGIRERVVPLARLRVPIDELTRAVRLAPQLIAPFEVGSPKQGVALSLVLKGVETDVEETIKIDDRSLHEQERKTAPPPVGHEDMRKSGVPGVSIPNGPTNDQSGVHTHPTVRRMVAVRPEALRSGNDDD